MLAQCMQCQTDVVEVFCHRGMFFSIHFSMDRKSMLVILNRFFRLAKMLPCHADVVEVYCYIRMPIAV